MIDQILTQLHTISIHALHEESDAKYRLDIGAQQAFQSTLSMRRATPEQIPSADLIIRISIHALHEESDFAVKCRQQSVFRFQSTLSMRRATQ